MRGKRRERERTIRGGGYSEGWRALVDGRSVSASYQKRQYRRGSRRRGEKQDEREAFHSRKLPLPPTDPTPPSPCCSCSSCGPWFLEGEVCCWEKAGEGEGEGRGEKGGRKVSEVARGQLRSEPLHSFSSSATPCCRLPTFRDEVEEEEPKKRAGGVERRRTGCY
jgi:hypothetical protein